jgi:hypothetical protein
MKTLEERVIAFAHSVVAIELAADERDPLSVADRIVTKLHGALGKLVGPAGFEALLARALVLAVRACPSLGGVRAAPGGRIEGFREALAGADKPTIAIAAEALLEHFLQLLLVLIGEDVGMGLAGVAWQEVAAKTKR